MADVRIETVAGELAGQRIDNYLLRVLKGVPRSRVYRLLRRGEVRVNGGRVRPTRRLRAGDRVRIPPLRETGRGEPMAPSTPVRQRLEAAILYEDERMLVIDKPAGLAVHGGSGIAYGIVEALRVMRPEAGCIDLAHRLDRDTSGCLVLAKRRSTLRTLHGLFRDNAVDKHYTALLHGRWPASAQRVELALRAERGPGGERVMRAGANGLAARTDFRLLASYPACSLIEARLHTGRMHQIRAHAAAIGHPVALDHRYGDAEADQWLRGLGLRRLFLHAARLGFEAPHCGPVSFEAPLPGDLRAVLQRLDSAAAD